MTVSRSLSAVVLVFLIAASLALGGCGNWRGDEEVETEPAEGSSEGPGLFTGKEGGIVIEVDTWKGASPYEDTAE